MIELYEYIYNNYPTLKEKVPRWRILSLLDRNQDKIVYIKENDIFKGAGMFVTIDDELLGELKIVSEQPEMIYSLLSNPDGIRELLKEKGDNIHFLYVLADSFSTIRKGLRETIEKRNPKTISWFNPKMNKLHLYDLKKEGVLCL